MKGGIPVIAFVAFSLVFGVVAFNACAEHGKDKKGGYDRCGKDKTHDKAHFFLKNKEELGLTDEQVKEIKDLKIAAKKAKIANKAEIASLDVDIKAKMWESPMDTAATDELIDRKYELKKEKAKASIRTHARLRNILTEEQKQKMKGLRKK